LELDFQKEQEFLFYLGDARGSFFGMMINYVSGNFACPYFLQIYKYYEE
jgi:hypothetical protein